MSFPFAFGWLDRPTEVARVVAQLPVPFLTRATAPALTGSGAGKDVFFWELESQVLGRILPAWDQGQLGSCVAHGWGRAVQDLLLAQIALGNTEGWEGHEVAREPIYGGSRVEVGGERGSYEDGSVGAWAAKWVSEWGILLYGAPGLEGDYDVRRCREWGARGVPSDLETAAKLHPVKTVSVVQSADVARDALANLYPIAICGSRGRTVKRAPGGWCHVEGNWNHCQELCGVCVVKGNKPALVYRNSWADYLGPENNRVQLESGREIELPMGCYLSTFEECEPDLRLGDSFALSHAVGFPNQSISWIF
jgi:hypothetical protein